MSQSNLAVLGVTILLSLAIKQLSYAIFNGSLFEPLRSYVTNKTEEGVQGFRVINQLLTCRLCISMQTSIWFVMIPIIATHYSTNIFQIMFGATDDIRVPVILVIVASFLYAMAVSALALGLWIFLEYPADRYQAVKSQLAAAERALIVASELLNAKPAETQGENRTEYKVFSWNDFKEMMLQMHKKCSRIGCGYDRRDCREDSLNAWLKKLATENSIDPDSFQKLFNQVFQAVRAHFKRFPGPDDAIKDDELIKLYETCLTLVRR